MVNWSAIGKRTAVEVMAENIASEVRRSGRHLTKQEIHHIVLETLDELSGVSKERHDRGRQNRGSND